MARTKDAVEPQWLVQECEGSAAPKTPGRWKSMWASDCAKLEEAHTRGDAEVLVFGRKYVVNMKERTVRPLYFKERKARSVIRATYFVQQGNGWLPHSEKDSEILENFYSSSKTRIMDGTFKEAEVPFSDGENKVVMKRVKASEPVDQQSEEFRIEFQQKPIKAPSMLATRFMKTAFEVRRGNPEPGKWGGVPSSEGDELREKAPPTHLVFVVHGMGESLWSRPSSSLGSLRNSCASMRKMSAMFLDSQRQACKEEGKQLQDNANDFENMAGGGEQGTEAGYVEFLPVEWFDQVHGDEAVEGGMIQDITLDTIPAFREFTNQAIMDVMFYLTPELRVKILKTVANELNRMWETFTKYTPEFTGKVSVLAHSLGSIIAHDVFMAQPEKGGISPTDRSGAGEIPLVKFEPEVLLACGSPIGTFLSLRASTLDKENLFKFKTTKRFFNLFHMHDPVAYRLEPLLDTRLRDLPPEHVPHKGGDRIHVVMKKFNRDMNAAIDRVQRSTTTGLSQFQSTLTSTLKSVTGMADAVAVEEKTPSEEVQDAKDKLRERIDWAIQESAFEGMHPWASAVFAHSSYFQNIDMIMFLINAMNENDCPEQPRKDQS